MEAMCIEFNGCKRILELGAGYSSLCLRKLGAHVTSFDHDIMYAEHVEQYLWNRKAPNPHVGLIADMKMAMRTWGLTQYYSRYDGILVDHGPDMTDRIYDMHTIIKCLTPGGVIIMDDYKGAYKQQVKLPGFHIQTHHIGSRHWGVATRTGAPNV
jgi:predicted O-methyltransferase YrrM